jgi:hypothetical protein
MSKTIRRAAQPARTWRTGYGRWFAELRLPNGRIVTGGGCSEGWAVYRATLKAQEVGR